MATALTPVQSSQTTKANAKALAANSSTSGTTGSGSSTGSTSSSSSTDNSELTSSDFLTLLVSELQNQDPTQPVDPTTYVQQLVGVNSLEQLVSINQELA